jgi:hypothetical protein
MKNSLLPVVHAYGVKEPKFFLDHKFWSQGCGYYLWQNQRCHTRKKLTGKVPSDLRAFGPTVLGMDATPLFGNVGSARRIASLYGARSSLLRFVIMLRNPVDRVHSWFGHFHAFDKYKDNGYVSTNILNYNDFLVDGLHGLGNSSCTNSTVSAKHDAICKSIYVQLLKEWVQHFEPSQFLLLSFSDFVRDPQPALLAIADHLYLPPQAKREVS